MAHNTRRSPRTSGPPLPLPPLPPYEQVRTDLMRDLEEAWPSATTPVVVTPPVQKSQQKVLLPEPMITTKASGQPQAQTTPDAEVDVRIKRAKTPSVIKRARRNKILAKMLQPKPALMLLHELKPGLTFTILDPSHSCSGATYTADAVLDGKVVGSGTGTSKNGAKHNAAEMALKQIVRETMANPGFLSALTGEKRLGKPTTGDVSMENNEDNEMDDGEGEKDDIAETAYEKLPWVTLASFALHRMFDDWKKDGVVVHPPAIKPGSVPTQVGASAPVLDDSKIPENANLMHPVSLLNQLHPGIKAEELQRTSAPNSSVTMGYRIDGQLYTGTATNGKSARKMAAQRACNAVYGINFALSA